MTVGEPHDVLVAVGGSVFIAFAYGLGRFLGWRKGWRDCERAQRKVMTSQTGSEVDRG